MRVSYNISIVFVFTCNCTTRYAIYKALSVKYRFNQTYQNWSKNGKTYKVGK